MGWTSATLYAHPLLRLIRTSVNTSGTPLAGELNLKFDEHLSNGVLPGGGIAVPGLVCFRTGPRYYST